MSIPTDDPCNLVVPDGAYILSAANVSSFRGCSNLPSSTDSDYLPCAIDVTPSWSATLLRNAGDAAQVRQPDGTFLHGFSDGNVNASTVRSHFPRATQRPSVFQCGPGYGDKHCGKRYADMGKH